MNKLSKERIKRIVDNLLSNQQIITPPVDVESVALSLDIEVIKNPYHGNSSMSGVLIRELDRIIIGVNASQSDHRQRFTIAHEIGHYLLHNGNQIYVDRKYKVNFRDQKSGEGSNLEEVEANTFASMLLIPEEMLLKDLCTYEVDILERNNVKKLADKYNVSPEAMGFRLNRLYSI